jgi:hypothetical protein
MRRSIARRRSKKAANQSTRMSPLVRATKITSLLSRMDCPLNAMAVLTGIVKVRLVNEPSADGAMSAANAVAVHAASAATISMAFMDAPLRVLGTTRLWEDGT